MSRIAYIVFFALLVVPCISDAETIDVHIKGVDDGVKTTKQRDYKEAVLFAKREAIERAGVKIKAITTVKDLVLNSDYIESQAEAVLLPEYNILDMGYSADGTYQVVLVGKVNVGETSTTTTKRESTFTKLISMGHTALEAGQIEKAKKLAEKALDIPGFENNPDAKWLLKQSSDELKRRYEEKTVFSSKNRFQVRNRFIKTYTHPQNQNVSAIVTIEPNTKLLVRREHDGSYAYVRARTQLERALQNDNLFLAQVILESGGQRKDLRIRSEGMKWGKWFGYGQGDRIASESIEAIVEVQNIKLTINLSVQIIQEIGLGMVYLHYVYLLNINHLKIERTDLKY
jgi:hypothetical protein